MTNPKHFDIDTTPALQPKEVPDYEAVAMEIRNVFALDDRSSTYVKQIADILKKHFPQQ